MQKTRSIILKWLKILAVFFFVYFLFSFKPTAYNYRVLFSIFDLNLLFTGLKLFLTVIFLLLIGFFVNDLSNKKLWFNSYKYNLIHLTVTGEVFLFLYLYVRFFINYILYHYYGYYAPITLIDLGLIFLVICYYYTRKIEFFIIKDQLVVFQNKQDLFQHHIDRNNINFNKGVSSAIAYIF